MIRPILVLTVLLHVPRTAAAERPLQLAEVLESVVRTHPKAAAARAKMDEAAGKALAGRAAFDTMLRAEAFANPTGYYDHGRTSIGVAQRIPGTGALLEGKYRVSRGNIAPYYGERRTREGGEVSARVVVPLVANMATDSERTAIRQADSQVQVARRGQDQVILELLRNATVAYYQWAASGQKLAVSQEQVGIADTRASTIREQAARGAIPRIDRTDAERVLLARRDSLLKARAEFLKAQRNLSLYYRTKELRPLTVPLVRLPETIAPLRPLEGKDVEVLLEAALSRRPELAIIGEQRKQAQAELRLARNQRLPTLDLDVYAARDLGAGDPSLGRTDLGVGLVFKFPILQREGRGKAAAARARLAALRASERGLRDRIAAEIRQTLELVELRREQAELARQRWTATQTLARAERARLAQGASDILRVNLREKDVASAASNAIDAELEMNTTLAELHFVVGRTPR